MDLAPSETAILQNLAKKKRPTKADPLRKAAGISYNWFQQTINDLIDRGLVDYDTDESKQGRGRKPYIYTITAKGRKLI